MASKDAELGEQILRILEEKGRLDSYEFSQETSREHQSVVGAIKSLQSVGNVSAYTEQVSEGHMHLTGYLVLFAISHMDMHVLIHWVLWLS